MTALERVQQILPTQVEAWGDLFNTAEMYDGMARESNMKQYQINHYYDPRYYQKLIDNYIWIAVFSICLADYLALQIPPDSP
jgi:hypothetical protein